jgi:hypothetical protein
MEGVWKGMDVMASMLHVAVTGINLVIKLVLCMAEEEVITETWHKMQKKRCFYMVCR